MRQRIVMRGLASGTDTDSEAEDDEDDERESTSTGGRLGSGGNASTALVPAVPGAVAASQQPSLPRGDPSLGAPAFFLTAPPSPCGADASAAEPGTPSAQQPFLTAGGLLPSSSASSSSSAGQGIFGPRALSAPACPLSTAAPGTAGQDAAAEPGEFRAKTRLDLIHELLTLRRRLGEAGGRADAAVAEASLLRGAAEAQRRRRPSASSAGGASARRPSPGAAAEAGQRGSGGGSGRHGRHGSGGRRRRKRARSMDEKEREAGWGGAGAPKRPCE